MSFLGNLFSKTKGNYKDISSSDFDICKIREEYVADKINSNSASCSDCNSYYPLIEFVYAEGYVPFTTNATYLNDEIIAGFARNKANTIATLHTHACNTHDKKCKTMEELNPCNDCVKYDPPVGNYALPHIIRRCYK